MLGRPLGSFDSSRISHLSKMTMKSKKNLTRFTYENAAFEGWRLCVSRGGTTFTKYFPDKKYGDPQTSLDAAETTLIALLEIMNSGKRIGKKLCPITVSKAEELLAKIE